MLRNKLHYLIGVTAGTVVSYGIISAQWLQPAQAAVLTSNFEIYDVGEGFGGFHNGTFNFDNSSLTGQGREWINVLSGVFNFVKPGFPRKPYAYDLSSGRVNFLDGKFRGLSAGGRSSSDEPMDFRNDFDVEQGKLVERGYYRNLGWSIEAMQPYGRNILVGLEGRFNGRFYAGISGQIAYSEPAEIGTVPVPEPTTIIGTAFAFASLVQLKRKRKNLS
ncbi:PEP-CTERM sorting domain-containing protein [Tychonema sp. BBK16]|uniref:PEP-CTERM sorting domain-containing protein n=1 Tax=Tychonema sp. BBK16 TaxID=2699888 RepID=UPI001F1B1752|nr:PEP-CTERM sorting domain-containing protein [Tychonema sp. BBK16]MCF6373171.1 PEP-CTERM sorting domain-containing protein [Tychonema sp. BBK16]